MTEHTTNRPDPARVAALMATAQARYRRDLEQCMFAAELADTHRIDAYEHDQEYGS